VIQFRREKVLSFSSDSGDGECLANDAVGHQEAAALQTNDADTISNCLDLICSCGDWFLGELTQSTRRDDGSQIEVRTDADAGSLRAATSGDYRYLRRRVQCTVEEALFSVFGLGVTMSLSENDGASSALRWAWSVWAIAASDRCWLVCFCFVG
jgi:hypothetical protein